LGVRTIPYRMTSARLANTSAALRILCTDAGSKRSQGGAEAHVIWGIAKFEGTDIVMHHDKLARKTCMQRRAEARRIV